MAENMQWFRWFSGNTWPFWVGWEQDALRK